MDDGMGRPGPAKLALRDVLVRRQGRTVLEVSSLEVMDGEVLAVLGPNGAGKSTLLRVLALLERPSSGQVLWEGRPVTGDPLPYRRRMAVVFQEPLLLDMTVEANVRLGMSLRGLPRREQKQRARRWLERLGVAHLAHRSARHLSGGEAQRVSLARALALSPEVLLLDEPFAALDAPMQQEMIDELESLLRETATTAVLVTHDRAQALRLGDRVAVLMDGRLRQVGPPQTVFAQPADAEVARFLGVENVLPAEVVAVQGGLAQLQVGPHIVWAAAESLRGEGQAWACVRPEHIVLAPLGSGEEAGSARNRLPARVTRLAPVGPGPQVRVDLDCGFPLVAYVTATSAEQLGLRPGATVVASFKALSVHLIPR